MSDELLKPAARCPWCRARPPFRIPESQRDRCLELAPETLVLTVGCHTCGREYPITAEALAQAAA